MTAVLHPLCAVIAFAGLLYKVRDLRRNPRNGALLALCLTLALSCLSFVVSTPVVWVRIDGLFGIPNIAALIAQSAVMALVACQQVVLTLWTHPPAQARPGSAFCSWLTVWC